MSQKKEINKNSKIKLKKNFKPKKIRVIQN